MTGRIKLFAPLACLSIGTGLGAQSLEDRWQDPPSDSRPWNFWYWMYGAFTREGITADLEAMKENGLGGAYQFTIRDVSPTYIGQITGVYSGKAIPGFRRPRQNIHYFSAVPDKNAREVKVVVTNRFGKSWEQTVKL